MVHIIGAGPGDPELITVKGQRYLSEADVVIYAGSLVNPKLLDYCKDGAEIHIGLSRDPAGWQVREVVIRLHDRPSLDAAE